MSKFPLLEEFKIRQLTLERRPIILILFFLGGAVDASKEVQEVSSTVDAVDASVWAQSLSSTDRRFRRRALLEVHVDIVDAGEEVQEKGSTAVGVDAAEEVQEKNSTREEVKDAGESGADKGEEEQDNSSTVVIGDAGKAEQSDDEIVEIPGDDEKQDNSSTVVTGVAGKAEQQSKEEFDGKEAAEKAEKALMDDWLSGLDD